MRILLYCFIIAILFLAGCRTAQQLISTPANNQIVKTKNGSEMLLGNCTRICLLQIPFSMHRARHRAGRGQARAIVNHGIAGLILTQTQKLRGRGFQFAGAQPVLDQAFDQGRFGRKGHSDQCRRAQDVNHETTVHHHQHRHRGAKPQAGHQALTEGRQAKDRDPPQHRQTKRTKLIDRGE